MTPFRISLGAALLVPFLLLAACGSVSTVPGTETLPVVTTPAGPGGQPSAVVVLSGGDLLELTPAHPASGRARLIRLATGRHVIRLEGFSVLNGPALRVWASDTASLTNDALRAAPYTDLGALRSTSGDLTYELPADLDISRVRSVVIWCSLAGVAFGGAALK